MPFDKNNHLITAENHCPLKTAGRALLFSLLFLIPLFSEAQILNIERLRLEKKLAGDTSKNILIKATAGLNMFNRSAAESNPVNFFGYNIDFNSIYYPKQHSYTFLGKFDYLRINENDFLNFGFLHGRINFYRERTISYETFVQYSYDNFRGLDPRWIAGAALRLKLYKDESTTIILSSGAMYEYEKWQSPTSEQEFKAHFLKSTNYLSVRKTLNNLMDFNMVTYYQGGYDRGIKKVRNRISSSIILNSKLSKRFSWNNSFDISYEDKPIVPITKLIFSLKTGISIDF